MLAGPLPGIYDPSGPGRMLFAFFAAMAETERESIREATLEGLDAVARKGKHGGRPAVITEDMLHTVLRRRATGETVEAIQPDLIIPTGKRKGKNPSVASIYRALAEHEKAKAYLRSRRASPHRLRRPEPWRPAGLHPAPTGPRRRADQRRSTRPTADPTTPLTRHSHPSRSSYCPFWSYLGCTPVRRVEGVQDIAADGFDVRWPRPCPSRRR